MTLNLQITIFTRKYNIIQRWFKSKETDKCCNFFQERNRKLIFYLLYESVE